MELDLFSADSEVYAVVPVEIRTLPEFIGNDCWGFYGGCLCTTLVWYDTVNPTVIDRDYCCPRSTTKFLESMIGQTAPFFLKKKKGKGKEKGRKEKKRKQHRRLNSLCTKDFEKSLERSDYRLVLHRHEALLPEFTSRMIGRSTKAQFFVCVAVCISGREE